MRIIQWLRKRLSIDSFRPHRISWQRTHPAYNVVAISASSLALMSAAVLIALVR